MIEPEREEGFATVQDAQRSPLEQEKTDFEKFRESYKKDSSEFSAGYAQAASRFALPDPTLKRTAGETFWATMEEGLSGDIFRKATIGKTPNYTEEGFNRAELLRPQDEPYIGYLASINNTELFREAQADIDRRIENLKVMSARPWVSTASSFVDPVELGLGVATYGAFNALTLPAASYLTAKSIRAAQLAAKAPRKAKFIAGGIEGALTGAAQTAFSVRMQADINTLKDDSEMAHHMMWGAITGKLIGGGVGLLGITKASKLINEFVAADKFIHEHGNVPPPGSSTTPPAIPTTIIGGRARYDTGLRMQAKGPLALPSPKTIAQTISDADALKFKVGAGGLPQRISSYAELKANLTSVGEKFVESLPKPVQTALDFVKKPLRNMSFVNRALGTKFGVAKYAALRYARNALEVMGTRTGFIVERSAQYRMEDLANTVVNVSVDANAAFLEANNIKPGMFAGERQKMGELVYPESKFYEDIGTQVLHVGKQTEHLRGMPETVKKTARQYFDEVYEPAGKLLKEYGYLDKNASMDDVINYLNRHWDTIKLMDDPEGFKNWMADYFRSVNEALKSIKPNYDNIMGDALKMKAIGNRFVKAANEIDKLNDDIVKKNVINKIQDVKDEAGKKINEALFKYESLKQKVDNKKEMSAHEIDTLKKEVKNETDILIKDKEKTLKAIDDKKIELKAEISDIRAALKKKVIRARAGDFDRELIQELVKAHFEENYNISKEMFDSTASVAEKTNLMNNVIAEIDNDMLKAFRKEKIADLRLEAVQTIDDIKPQIKELKKERTEFKKMFDKEVGSIIKESMDLLSQKGNPTVNARLKIKYIDLKERHEILSIERDAATKLNKLMEPILKLDYLQRRYSEEGFGITAARKQALKMASFMPNKDMQKAAIKAARKAEKDALKAMTVKNEARALGEDLIAAYEKEAARAEELIPREYRSTSTGKPYRIFDEAVEPTYAYDQATRTFNTMIGTGDELVINPTLVSLGGGPSILKPRNVNMPDNYPGIENYVQRDIRFLAQSFIRGASPVIAMHEMMLDMNKMQVFKDTLKRMQVEKYGAKRALTMPDEMVSYNEVQGVLQAALLEEHRINSKDLVGKELDKATKEYKQGKLAIEKINAQVMGTNAEGFNVNASDASDFVDNFNAAVSTVTTSNIVISMLSDSMSPAFRYGLGKYVEKSLAPLLSDPALYQMNKAELRGLNIALKTGVSAILKNKISGNPGSMKNSTFGVFANNLSSRLQNITGSSSVQDIFTVAATVLIKTDLLDVAQNVSRGTATQKQLTHLAQRGMSPDTAKSVSKLFEKYGWEKGSVKGIDPSKMKSMTPDEGKAFTAYMNFINDELRATQVQPGIGSLPDWSGHWAGKSVLYLKRWFFAATNDLIIPALQRADSEAAQGFAGMFMIGALQTQVRRIYRGEEFDTDFNKTGFVVDAMTNAGLLGIYSFPVDLASLYGFLPSMGGSRYNPGNGLASYIGGPGVVGYSDKALNVLSRIYKITTDEDRIFTYKDFNQMASIGLPMYKFAPISALAQPRLKEYFESQGRLE